jgi:hypothetical protein
VCSSDLGKVLEPSSGRYDTVYFAKSESPDR